MKKHRTIKVNEELHGLLTCCVAMNGDNSIELIVRVVAKRFNADLVGNEDIARFTTDTKGGRTVDVLRDLFPEDATAESIRINLAAYLWAAYEGFKQYRLPDSEFRDEEQYVTEERNNAIR